MTAVASAEVGLQYPDRIFVDGAWAQPATAARVDVYDSTTEQLLYQVADAQEVDMSRAISAARAAFDRGPWPQLSHHERAAFLEAFARAIAARGDQLSKIWSRQMGILNTLAHASYPAPQRPFPTMQVWLTISRSWNVIRRQEERPQACLCASRSVSWARSSLECADRAHFLQDRPGVAGGLHGSSQSFSGGSRRGLRDG